MSALHDLLGSIIIGGIVLLMLLTFNGNVMQSAGVQTFNTVVQSNLTTTTNILEYDFRKIGYRVAGVQDSACIYADSNKVIVRGDFNNDGTVDRLAYYISTTQAPGSSNPKSRILYRQLNFNPAQPMNVGVTRFQLRYYTAAGAQLTGNPISSPGAIKSYRITINVEGKERFVDSQPTKTLGNPFGDTTFVGAYWQRTFKPINVR
jgi:hypothetical protein